MSKTTEILTQGAVLVPKSSGFDMSRECLFTSKCGQLVPIFVEQTLPGDVWSLGLLAEIKLPPLASDFFGRVDINIEAFFVPYRLCYGGWTEFITMPKLAHNDDSASYRNPVDNVIGGKINADNGTLNRNTRTGRDSVGNQDDRSFSYANRLGIPDVVTPSNYPSGVYEQLPSGLVNQADSGAGSLLDFLGMKTGPVSVVKRVYNVLLFVAYHKIWNDYYRNSFLENPAFIKPDETMSGAALKTMPYARYTTSHEFNLSTQLCADGTPFASLRYRKWADDYFTTCTPTPRGLASGKDVTVKTGLGTTAGHDASGNNNQFMTGFTIPMLRTANTLQMFLERANVAGWKYRDAIRSQWGVTPSDCCETAIYLGRYKTPIYNNSIAQSQQVTDDALTTNVPWARSAGYTVATPSATGSGSLFSNFKVKEHGVIMCLFSLTPHAYYGTGTHRRLNCKHIYDFADPLLQNVGTQAVYEAELTNVPTPTPTTFNIFGYTTPFAEWCTACDEVHGILRSGSSLENLVLSRDFSSSSAPRINAQFATISESAMDNVCATTARISEYGCYGQVYFDCQAVRPLQKYIIPTLGTPEFMRTAIVSKGGTKING